MRLQHYAFDKLANGRRTRSETGRTQLARHKHNPGSGDGQQWENQSLTVPHWRYLPSDRHDRRSDTSPSDFAGRAVRDAQDASRFYEHIARTQDTGWA